MANRFDNFTMQELNVLQKQASMMLSRFSQKEGEVCERLLAEIEATVCNESGEDTAELQHMD